MEHTTFPAGSTGLPADWDPDYWRPVCRDGRFLGAYAPDGVWVPVETVVVFGPD